VKRKQHEDGDGELLEEKRKHENGDGERVFKLLEARGDKRLIWKK
jgi:hypothetical protein